MHCHFVFFGMPVVILSMYRINVFFCLKNKLKIPNRPHASNNCSELRKSYKQHGYLDKNNSRHTVNFFPFSRHTVNFLDVSRHTLNPIETLLKAIRVTLTGSWNISRKKNGPKTSKCQRQNSSQVAWNSSDSFESFSPLNNVWIDRPLMPSSDVTHYPKTG